jgi:hypothetical protein
MHAYAVEALPFLEFNYGGSAYGGSAFAVYKKGCDPPGPKALLARCETRFSLPQRRLHCPPNQGSSNDGGKSFREPRLAMPIPLRKYFTRYHPTLPPKRVSAGKSHPNRPNGPNFGSKSYKSGNRFHLKYLCRRYLPPRPSLESSHLRNNFARLLNNEN